jgi:PAS domain S-box-containing protein
MSGRYSGSADREVDVSPGESAPPAEGNNAPSLQTILDAVSDGIVFTNKHMVIEYVNPAVEQLTGYPAAELLGETPQLWDSGLTPPGVLKDMRHHFERGQPWRGEAIFRRKDGTPYHVALAINPLKDANGETIGFVRIQRDITASIELDRLKNQFVSRIGHELRTPLTNLILYLDLLEHGRPENREQYMATLNREAGRMRRLVKGFVKIAELRAQQIPLEWTWVDLNGLIGEIVHNRRVRADQLQLGLLFEPDLNLPQVMIDAALIGEVVDRLLDNALSYTPRSGCVMVTTDLDQTRDQVGVRFAVQDTGPGIPPDELPRLFEGFHRGAATASFAVPGAGLGLAICNEIVTLHHGRIEVDSQLGQGSVFRVWLPLKQEVAAPA